MDQISRPLTFPYGPYLGSATPLIVLKDHMLKNVEHRLFPLVRRNDCFT